MNGGGGGHLEIFKNRICYVRIKILAYHLSVGESTHWLKKMKDLRFYVNSECARILKFQHLNFTFNTNESLRLDRALLAKIIK